MPEYRRARRNGGTFLFTVVTSNRIRILDKPIVLSVLRASIEATRSRYPMKINAWVILPDHMHFVWTLPTADDNYSRRISLIKSGVSRRLSATFYGPSRSGTSGKVRRERSIWQRRFREHCIEDGRDLKQHLDYVHFNPVKHGLVSQVRDWPHSSFAEYCRRGLYHPDWGGGRQRDLVVGE